MLGGEFEQKCGFCVVFDLVFDIRFVIRKFVAEGSGDGDDLIHIVDDLHFAKYNHASYVVCPVARLSVTLLANAKGDLLGAFQGIQSVSRFSAMKV